MKKIDIINRIRINKSLLIGDKLIHNVKEKTTSVVGITLMASVFEVNITKIIWGSGARIPRFATDLGILPRTLS